MGNLQTIRRVAANAHKLNFDAIVRDSFEQTKGTINLYDRQTLKQGFKVDGSRIGTYASVPYARKKFAENPEAGLGFIDLYLYGTFSEGIETMVNSKSFTTFSVDSKATKLELKYSPLIFGLPNKNIPDYVKVVGPVIFNRTKAAIFGL